LAPIIIWILTQSPRAFITIQIIQPVFKTDTSQKYYLKKFPAIFFKADTFEVGGINIRKLLFDKSIELNVFSLHNPSVVILLQPNRDTAAAEAILDQQPDNNGIYQIGLDNLHIWGGAISFIQLQRPEDTLYYGNKINIELSGVTIPTQAKEGIYKTSTIKNVLFTMSNVAFNPTKSPYSFLMNEVNFNAKKNIVTCRGVSVYPEKSLSSMSKSSRYQKTFAQININNILLRGLDYAKITESELRVNYAEIANSTLFLLRDRNIKLNKSLQKKCFQEALLDIKFPMEIDTIGLRNIHLNIMVNFPGQTDPATIRIHHINGSFLHTNNEAFSNKEIYFHATAKIMNSGDLIFDATYPINTQTHTYTASIKSMPFAEWNGVISKLSNVRIESGTIDHIALKGNATSMETTGSIVFEYRDLQATAFKNDKNGHLKKAALLTFGVNGLLRLRNPDNGESKPIRKNYYYKREPWQGQIMLWVGGLLDGIEATLLNENLKRQVDKVEAVKVKTRKK
jgi:hypothetical protein